MHSLGRKGRKLRTVENKIRFRLVFSIESPVPEQHIAKIFFVLCGRLEKAGRDDLVRVHILHLQRHAGAFDNIEFLFHSKSLGSVTQPVTAAAAAVRGLARRVLAPGP